MKKSVINELVFNQRLNYCIGNTPISYIAQQLDIPLSSLHNWVVGRNLPHRESIAKLAKYFNVSAIWLTGQDK